ncbi:hypothetical protein VPH35_006980 [Triticum aestivum]
MSSIGRVSSCGNVAVDAAAVALAKVSLVNGEGSGGNAGEGGGMVDSKGNAGGINETCKVGGVFCSPHIGADSVEGISSPDVNDFIMQSCRDINAQHVAPNSPPTHNMAAPPNVEPCRASDGDNFVCSLTPLWCDTQSQSVIGNEIVTQDYMVSQQLRNEEIRQLEKRNFFPEKVDAHERKKRLRLPKGLVDTSNVTSNAHAPDTGTGVRVQVGTSRDPPSGVASKTVVPSPCRSPRIASGPVVDRVYPSIKLGGKRCSEAGGDFVGGPSVDGIGLDGDNVVHRKRRPKVVGSGAKKKVAKSAVSNAGACDRINVTVRCSLGEVSEAATLLETRHRDIVRKAGFGCVFN